MTRNFARASGAAASFLFAVSAFGQSGLETTIEDFFLHGTQPAALADPISTHTPCTACHNNADGLITTHWQGSIMAHAGRDPLFYACLDVANQMAPSSGDMCIRCHMPKAWLEGRSSPTDATAVTAADRDSINCNFCHRMVDPANPPGEPAGDAGIIESLLDGPPVSPGNGSFVIDPEDLRRGPFSDAQCAPFHPFAVSPFYKKSEFCGTCHDVSNPGFDRQPDDTYTLGPVDERHPSGDKYEMRPVERTYSEWLSSAYAIPPGVDAGGRFGGPGQTFVSTCQDCHMPDISARGCSYPAAPVRADMPRHHLNGAATWTLDAIKEKYGAAGTGELTGAQEAALTAAKARNIDMLQAAASLEVTMEPSGAELRVRVINETGHKLPSGYPEGRRIWLNVKFYDCYDDLLAERGHYDSATAVLTKADTKVYEIESGVDAAVAAAANVPAGHSFHFVLNNVVLKDNRIPPRGFTNAAFEAIQSAPVDYVYADGQYWDDTTFAIPGGAVYAEVELFYQTSSKEYIEFLRDNNPNPPPNRGTELYALWESNGKSAPVTMAVSGAMDVLLAGDINGDRAVDAADANLMALCVLGLSANPYYLCAADINGVGGVDGEDVQLFVDAVAGP